MGELRQMGQGTCVASPGGVVACYVIKNEYIGNVTVDADNRITAVTPLSVGKVVKFVPNTQEDKPYYNQIGARQGTSNKFTQTGFYVFSGLDNDKRNALQEVTEVDCGCTVFHVLDNGDIIVQGIQWIPSKSKWAFTRKPCVATGDFSTNTAAANQEVTCTFVSETAYLSCFTTLTEVAIAAL